MRKLSAVLLVVLAACAGGDDRAAPPPTTRAPGPTTTAAVPVEDDAEVLLAAGDIGDCRSPGDEATADLLDDFPGTIAALGDLAYPDGTREEFARCFAPTWGRHKDRIRPALGNHDYETPGAAGYFGYFGATSGRRGEGWYSYDLGAWHVVALNSNCQFVACAGDGPQGRWLRADLAAHPATCTLAYWHHPIFSSGLHEPAESMGELYGILFDAGADVVLAGHDHHYERLAPLDPFGRVDEARGIRNFVVGTGGSRLYPTGFPVTGSEVREEDTHGVLELRLGAASFGWRFHGAAGPAADSGSGQCH